MTNSKSDHIPDADEKVRPSADDLEAYSMHTCQCSSCERVRSNDSRASVLEEVLDRVLEEAEKSLFKMVVTEEQLNGATMFNSRLKQIIQKAKGAY